MTEPIRVLIADDHPLFRDGLTALLTDAPDTELVGAATSGTEAVTDNVPSRSTPSAPVRSASTSSFPRASSPSITRARYTAASPSALAATPCGLRSNRRAPKPASTSESILLSAGWLRCSRAAAARMVPASASATSSSR